MFRKYLASFKYDLYNVLCYGVLALNLSLSLLPFQDSDKMCDFFPCKNDVCNVVQGCTRQTKV